MIRTKIVATMGPAVASVDTLVKLFEDGCGVCRLNFSHGTLDKHGKMLALIREAAARYGAPVAVLGDLCGPKIRLGEIADVDGTGGLPIDVGDELVIARDDVVGDFAELETGGRVRRVSSQYDRLVDDVQVGDRVLVEDGLLRFVCVDKDEAGLRLNCTAGGVLKTRKGINLPGTKVSIPAMTAEDWSAAAWAVGHEIDFLALSFVRDATDLVKLKKWLRDKLSDIRLIAKIEKGEALTNIDAILRASDGLMVARGDLGVEVELARVPVIQKQLIQKCREQVKPVIVATQMLQSMIEQATPTRAEVSDVANAIFDGADAVMLSGETSVGKFPMGAVLTMAHIAERSEAYELEIGPDERRGEPIGDADLAMSHAIARSVLGLAKQISVKAVVVYSQTGMTARIFSKHRFPVPIVALSSDERTLRKMNLFFGVLPVLMSEPLDMDDLVKRVDAILLERGWAAKDERVAVVAGASLGAPGTRNAIVLHTVGRPFTATANAAGPQPEGTEGLYVASEEARA